MTEVSELNIAAAQFTYYKETPVQPPEDDEDFDDEDDEDFDDEDFDDDDEDDEDFDDEDEDED